MNYTDRTLVALADPTARAALFDQDALAQIVSAGYEATQMGIHGPYSALFDELSLGLATAPSAAIEGTWGTPGGSEATNANLRISGLGNDASTRVEGLWRGAIVARFSSSHERITAAAAHWPSLAAVDETVMSAHGGTLPTDPTTLESERRSALVAEVQAGLDQPAAFGPSQLAGLLGEAGAQSVGDLLTHFDGVVEAGTVTVTFSPPEPVLESPRPLPIAAALLVRDAPLSLADLLTLSAAARVRLRALGVERPPDPGLKLARPVLVIWVVPKETFDDTDWPGADANARRAAAGAWLAREGIGLAVTAWPAP